MESEVTHVRFRGGHGGTKQNLTTLTGNASSILSPSFSTLKGSHSPSQTSPTQEHLSSLNPCFRTSIPILLLPVHSLPPPSPTPVAFRLFGFSRPGSLIQFRTPPPEGPLETVIYSSQSAVPALRRASRAFEEVGENQGPLDLAQPRFHLARPAGLRLPSGDLAGQPRRFCDVTGPRVLGACARSYKGRHRAAPLRCSGLVLRSSVLVLIDDVALLTSACGPPSP